MQNSFRVYIEQQHFLVAHSSSNSTVIDPPNSSMGNSSAPNWVTVSDNSSSLPLDLLDIWHFSRETCMYIYSTLMVLLIVFTMVRVFVFFNVCMRASTNLHNNMFQNITRASMGFFNTNSAGRILNRFSKVKEWRISVEGIVSM